MKEFALRLENNEISPITAKYIRWVMQAAYFVVILFGLVIGSFVNVLIYRIPIKKSIVLPASFCPNCGRRLAASDLVPVISYIFLRGRCRYCHARISPRYPAVEALTALIFLALYIKYGLTVPFFAFAFLMTILTAVFFIDYDHRIIPDGLVLAATAGGAALAVYNYFMPLPEIYGDTAWWTPVVGFFSASGFLLLVALIGGAVFKSDDAMGMGDVKLMAPVGLFLGWKLCLAALFISVAAAGLTSIFLILMRLKKRRDTIPFGPFLAAGVFIVILWGWDLLNWYLGRL